MTSALLSKEFRRSLETAVARYQRVLQSENGEAARAYLSERGLPPNVVKDYRLGLVDADSPDHIEFAGWMSIPYLTRSGAVGIKFHNPGGKPKYKQATGHETRLFNTLAMDEADRTGILGIAEGEFDAIVATALCGISTVGIPGVDTYKSHPEWRELFRGYQSVLIFEDQDEVNEQTGKRAGSELASKLRSDIDTSRIVRLPCKDVNDTYLAHGRDGVLRAAGLL